MNRDMYSEHVAALLKVLQTKRIIKDDKIPCQIEEGVYLGSVGAAKNIDLLKSLNITHILTVTHSVAPAYPNDFVYKIVPVPDREDIALSRFFDECFAFIEAAKMRGGGVLVHCYAGRSRSVTIIVAYLMFKNYMSLSEALEYVKMKRPAAAPNRGFMLQLQEYERSLEEARAKNEEEDEEEEPE